MPLLTATNTIKLITVFVLERYVKLQLSNRCHVSVLDRWCSYCYQEAVNRKSSVCPVCASPLNELARRLPYSHCAQSRLICSVSGLPLNEHNPPMMLPNGRVYGLTVCDVHFTGFCSKYKLHSEYYYYDYYYY